MNWCFKNATLSGYGLVGPRLWLGELAGEHPSEAMILTSTMAGTIPDSRGFKLEAGIGPCDSQYSLAAEGHYQRLTIAHPWIVQDPSLPYDVDSLGAGLGVRTNRLLTVPDSEGGSLDLLATGYAGLQFDQVETPDIDPALQVSSVRAGGAGVFLGYVDPASGAGVAVSLSDEYVVPLNDVSGPGGLLAGRLPSEDARLLVRLSFVDAPVRENFGWYENMAGLAMQGAIYAGLFAREPRMENVARYTNLSDMRPVLAALEGVKLRMLPGVSLDAYSHPAGRAREATLLRMATHTVLAGIALGLWRGGLEHRYATPFAQAADESFLSPKRLWTLITEDYSPWADVIQGGVFAAVGTGIILGVSPSRPEELPQEALGFEGRDAAANRLGDVLVTAGTSALLAAGIQALTDWIRGDDVVEPAPLVADPNAPKDLALIAIPVSSKYNSRMTHLESLEIAAEDSEFALGSRARDLEVEVNSRPIRVVNDYQDFRVRQTAGEDVVFFGKSHDPAPGEFLRIQLVFSKNLVPRGTPVDVSFSVEGHKPVTWTYSTEDVPEYEIAEAEAKNLSWKDGRVEKVRVYGTGLSEAELVTIEVSGAGGRRTVTGTLTPGLNPDQSFEVSFPDDAEKPLSGERLALAFELPGVPGEPQWVYETLPAAVAPPTLEEYPNYAHLEWTDDGRVKVLVLTGTYLDAEGHTLSLQLKPGPIVPSDRVTFTADSETQVSVALEDPLSPGSTMTVVYQTVGGTVTQDVLIPLPPPSIAHVEAGRVGRLAATGELATASLVLEGENLGTAELKKIIYRNTSGTEVTLNHGPDFETSLVADKLQVDFKGDQGMPGNTTFQAYFDVKIRTLQSTSASVPDLGGVGGEWVDLSIDPVRANVVSGVFYLIFPLIRAVDPATQTVSLQASVAGTPVASNLNWGVRNHVALAMKVSDLGGDADAVKFVLTIEGQAYVYESTVRHVKDLLRL